MADNKIPEDLIPEIIEWLMSNEKYDDGGNRPETVLEGYYDYGVGVYRKRDIRKLLAAALRAFNERK